MVKFIATRDTGTVMVGLGISEKNVELLKDGRPILVDLRELGITDPIEVMIFYGKTEFHLAQAIIKEFKVEDIQFTEGGM